jgi:hypothetical protein
MNVPPEHRSNDTSRTDASHSPELGPARTRERLVQRVLAARKRLPQTAANAVARTR